MTPPPESHADREPRPAGTAHRHDPAVSVVPMAARRFQGHRAGLITRVLANTVDFAVIVAALAAGYLGVAALRFLWNSRSFAFPTPSPQTLLLAGSAIAVIYLTGAWAITGRTYGDHVLGLRVVNWRGQPPRLGGALLRALFCAGFPIGLFWVLVSRENRSVQDVVLRTSVIHDWTAQPSRPV
jgi:uncharacterized RDD family membrane protein YckC